MSAFTVSARDDFARLAKRLAGYERQLPFAASLALTETAKHVRAAEIEEMARVFDKPTRYTLNSLRVTPARKTRLRAEVWFRDFPKSASDYLGPQVFGGERRLKRSEYSFGKKAGAKGKYFMPGQAIKQDRFGNVNRGTIVKIISDLQLFSDSSQNRNAEEKAGEYFIGSPGSAPFGVWRRAGKGRVEPMFIATDAAGYTQLLRFHEVGGATARRHLMHEFEKAARKAIATAR